MERKIKKQLPQEGTRAPRAVGESLSVAPAAGSPTLSEGGKILRSRRRRGRESGTELDSDDIQTEYFSESEDCLSVSSATSSIGSKTKGKYGGSKRTHHTRTNSGSDSEPSNEEVPKKKTPGRGRGRPPTTGQYVQLAKAKAQLLAIQKEELRVANETELAKSIDEVRNQRLMRNETAIDNTGEKTAEELSQQVRKGVEMVLHVSKSSGNLKGTFIRALKEASASIMEAVAEFRSISASEENRRLQAENNRLQQQVEDLQINLQEAKDNLWKLWERRKSRTVAMEEVEDTNDAPRSPGSDKTVVPDPTHQPTVLVEGSTAQVSESNDLSQSIMRQVADLIDSRFKALEGILARSPLHTGQTQKKQQKPDKGKKKSTKSAEKISNSEIEKQAGNTKRTQQKKKAENNLRPNSYAEAASRGIKLTRDVKASDAAKQKKPKQKAAARPPKIRNPRSSAVVLTLQPEAVERGVKYLDVLREAKSKLSLQEIGISALRVRPALTGARILEITGTDSCAKADSLANRLRENLSPHDVRVSRPIKCAEVRITDLDDSTEVDDVITSVAKIAECPADELKAGEIRRSESGIGTIWVRCPVIAAKKVAQMKKIQVGWVSARVTLLKPRPRRCYRCLEPGHVSAKCEAETDRSGNCFRCSQAGHKAANCMEKPHCPLCSAAGKSSDHRMGGTACSPPRKRKKPQISPPVVNLPRSREKDREKGEMETS